MARYSRFITSNTVPNVVLGLGLLCVFASVISLVDAFLSHNDEVNATVQLGSAQTVDGLCHQQVLLTFCNVSRREVRIVGFIPFCCSGQFGFAVMEAVDYPETFRPGQELRIACEASFSARPGDPGRILERVAGELLLDIDDTLVRKPVLVLVNTTAAIPGQGKASD